MIYQHEIPNGSCLYFGKVAKNKRVLENNVANYLEQNGFQEILTPSFSYIQHQSIDNENELIKINDQDNNQVSLRADSTLDVARIITKRLGRTTAHKKWFYIQPIFTYPSNETYQIGLEWLEHTNPSDIINLNMDLFTSIKLSPLLQISNIKIAKTISNVLNIPINLFKDNLIGELFDLKLDWLDKLIYATSIIDLKNVLSQLPLEVKEEVDKLINIASDVKYKNKTISALYYTKMKYYEDVYFKVMQDNDVLACGGRYKSDGISSLGFALYTKNILDIKG